jgi:Leucine-rich repeat (LRR) protein
MKTMKKMLFIMFAAAMMVFTGCEKNDDNELSTETQGNITLKVVAPSNDKIDLDKVVYYKVNAQFLIVDWGDGSAPETYSSSESSRVYEIRHTYANSSTTYTAQIKEKGLTRFEVSNFYRYTTLSLDFNGCPALEDLTCDDPLLSLNISECAALKEVICKTNNQSGLISVNVSGCSALELFDINNFTRYASSVSLILNVSGCPALKKLHCFNTGCTSLNISGCPALKTLECHANQLTSLDVSGCTALEELLCLINQLTSLDVSGLSALRDLQCSHNNLTSLNISGCMALERLFCDTNQLTASALNSVFTALPYHNVIDDNDRPTILYYSNPGTNTCNWNILWTKGWRGN